MNWIEQNMITETIQIYSYLKQNHFCRAIVHCLMAMSIYFPINAQKLEVEGNAKIRGLLDINHLEDTSSVYVGRNAGINVPTFSLFNTIVGSNTGYHNIDGERNSFFGESAGFNNVSGSDNVFLGRRAGYINNGFGNSFIGNNAGHNNVKGSANILIGFNAGFHNQGSNNTMIGSNAGRYISDTLSTDNTFIGSGAGVSTFGLLTVGSANTFVGQNAGRKIGIGGENTFIGQEAGLSNVAGARNTFIGQGAGMNNSSGHHNTFVGERSGDSNTIGEDNTFLGQNSGKSNDTGEHNTFVGKDAGRRNRFGSKNTCVGDSSNLSNAILNNAMALGYKAVADADNKVRIGNDSVTVIEGQVPFSLSSDIRLKEFINQLALGLDFINDLNPVIYHRKANPKNDLEMGLIAQELKSSLENFDMKDSGMVHQVGDRYMSVRYNDLFAPLIKAIQQLSKENDELKLENQRIQRTIQDQESRLSSLEKKKK